MKVQASSGRVLVGIDGSPASAAALRWAGAEARLRGMRLHVVHARDPHAVPQAHYAPPGGGRDAVGHATDGSALTALIREAVDRAVHWDDARRADRDQDLSPGLISGQADR